MSEIRCSIPAAALPHWLALGWRHVYSGRWRGVDVEIVEWSGPSGSVPWGEV
jgi:hypothetical protein